MKKTTLFTLFGIMAAVVLSTGIAFAGPGSSSSTFGSNPPGATGGGVGNLGNGIITTNSSSNFNNPQLDTTHVTGLFRFFSTILGMIPPILVAVAGVVFMFNIVKFIFEGNAEAKEKEKKAILLSLVALVVLLGFWAIVGVISRTLGINTNRNISTNDIPQVVLPR